MALPGPSWPRILRYGSAGRLLLLSLSLLFNPACSRLVNVTVDDTAGDPTTGQIPQYSSGSDDAWNAGSSSESCTDCHISQNNLDLSQIYKGTWHDTTFLSGETPVSITVQFTGSAVYVYNILPNTISDTRTAADISFSIDGEVDGHFIHPPDSSSSILYNQLVYSNTGLSNALHTLVMTPNTNSLILFDYFVYTVEVPDPSPSSSTAPAPASLSSSTSTSTHASSTSSTQSSSESSSPSVSSTSTSSTGSQSSSSATLPSTSPSASNGSSSPSTSTNSPNSDPAQSPSSSTPASTRSSDSPSKSPTSRIPIGAIVGAVAGGIALLLAAVLAIFLLCRRCRKPSSSRAARTQLRAGDGDGDGASFVPSMASATSISPLRFREGAATARRDSQPPIASPTSNYSNSNSTFLSSPDSTHPALRVSIPASPATLAVGRPPKPPSRAELAWRLEELQQTRSALSTPDPASGSRTGSNGNGARGTEMAIRDLEAEIASLRVALNAMNARLEDEHRGDAEFLPAYAE